MPRRPVKNVQKKNEPKELSPFRKRMKDNVEDLIRRGEAGRDDAQRLRSSLARKKALKKKTKGGGTDNSKHGKTSQRSARN